MSWKFQVQWSLIELLYLHQISSKQDKSLLISNGLGEGELTHVGLLVKPYQDI